MRTLKTIACMAAAAGLATAGVANAAGTQSVNMLPKASVAERATAPAKGANKVADDDNGSALLIAGGAIAAVIAGVIMFGDNPDGDTPN